MAVVLTACTSQGRYTAMRKGLDSINMLNKSYQPFTVADVWPYVQYFDDHGTSNDRVLAYYLMGRAYHDQREAPMALEYYQKATELADTTEAGFDFAQLSKVYGQMAGLFYQQNLNCHQEFRDHAIHYSLIGGDTLTALYNYEQKCNFYEKNNQSDCALYVIKRIITWYKQHGLTQDEAISCGRAAAILTKIGNYPEARRMMTVYEEKSGRFDSSGTIIKGYEIYYYYKALVLIHENKLDSAEYWFRKELRDGGDWNNQNAASYGLAMLFEKKNQPDSAYKYAIESYAKNDSLYSQMATSEVEHIQAMYDYTKNQKIAEEQSALARRERNILLLTLTISIILCLTGFVFIKMQVKKRRENDRKYKEGLIELEQVQSEVLLLRSHASEFEKLIAHKEEQIVAQKKKLQTYRPFELKDTAEIEKQIRESDIYQQIEKKALSGKMLSDNDWKEIHKLVIDCLPLFNDFLFSKKYELALKEYHTSILLRLHFSSKEIGAMLNISPARVSQICVILWGKLFHEEGNSKGLSQRLCDFF